ncbi:hypothetical protein [Cupriavidus necator]
MKLVTLAIEYGVRIIADRVSACEVNICDAVMNIFVCLLAGSDWGLCW